MVAPAIDPHRLQLAYGQHAISLGTIPDYYLENNSGTGEFLRHEAAWYDPSGQHPYGQSRAPVFSSGEMERLVMSPSALDDREQPGHPKRALPQRIIRRPQAGAGHAPLWTADGRVAPDAAMNGNGAHPPADSAGGYPGYAPEGSTGPRAPR
jgi:hypothetical protein